MYFSFWFILSTPWIFCSLWSDHQSNSTRLYHILHTSSQSRFLPVLLLLLHLLVLPPMCPLLCLPIHPLQTLLLLGSLILEPLSMLLEKLKIFNSSTILMVLIKFTLATMKVWMFLVASVLSWYCLAWPCVRLIILSAPFIPFLASVFTLLFLLMTLSSRVMIRLEFDNSKSTFNSNFILKIWVP